MKYRKLYDLLLTVFAPLLAGLFVYRVEQYIAIPAIIRYYVPDGLWAYAFGSCMLIVWERKIHWGWIGGAVMVSVMYELGQYYHFIPGIGEVQDVMTYLFFFSLALLSNAFFKRLLYAKTTIHEQTSALGHRTDRVRYFGPGARRDQVYNRSSDPGGQGSPSGTTTAPSVK
jgi:hypothetical protein